MIFISYIFLKMFISFDCQRSKNISIVTPVHKKKCKINNPSSYQPIALVLIMSKVLKYAMKSRSL